MARNEVAAAGGYTRRSALWKTRAGAAPRTHKDCGIIRNKCGVAA
jgi:hypothetical protein